MKKNNGLLIYFYIVSITIIPFLFSLIYEKQREEDFVFILLNAAIFLFPLFFMKKFKLYLGIISFFLFIPAFLDFGHILLFQGRITESTFFIIFDSNPSESLEFLDSYFSVKSILFIILYCSSIGIYFYYICRLKNVVIGINWKIYLLFFIFTPFVVKQFSSGEDKFEAYRRSNHFASMVHSYLKYNKQMTTFSSLNSKIKKDFDIINKNPFENDLHIFVVGESTTKNHMSLYGYSRKTTPELMSLKKELYIFKDVVSSHCGTLGNLKRIFTLGNKENESTESLSTTLINILNASSYNTYWFSNQLILGKHDTITTVFAKQSQKTVFTNTTNSKTYDEKLIPYLENVLEKKNEKSFVVLHLLGTHMKYRNRYPNQFNFYTTNEGIAHKEFHNKKKINYINEYDNSVRYHDFVLGKIIKLLKKYDERPITLTYLSDHGEEVYQIKNYHGHPAKNQTRNIFEIPFFMWHSSKYKESFGIITNKKLNYKYVTDDVIHTFFDLLKIYPKSYNPQKSILSDQFIFKKRPLDL